jgi:hypothetical protein
VGTAHDAGFQKQRPIKEETAAEVKKNGEPQDVHRRCGDA